MSDLDLHRVAIGLFLRLRRQGFRIGVADLLDLARLVEPGGPVRSLADLRRAASLLVCRSPTDERDFAAAWEAAPAVAAARPAAQPAPGAPAQESPADPPLSEPLARVAEPPPLPPAPAFAALPLRAPGPAADVDPPGLLAYYPVPRRSMVYAWHYLRRPVPDGPADVLDIDATVAAAARQGFMLAPVFRRRLRNQAHLVLLIDQGGSMVPFHRFARDLLETARAESTLRRVDNYFFHNAPGEPLYADHFLTRPMPLESALADINADTSVLIVSDAGAARGYRRLARLQLTMRFLSALTRRTSLIAWLNPMPAERWKGSTASLIAQLMPMFQLDVEGLGAAIDVVRGQAFQHER